MNTSEVCDSRDDCSRTAHHIRSHQQIARVAMLDVIPASPEALDTSTTPREAYRKALNTENTTAWLAENEAWAFEEAAKLDQPCEGCPIIVLCGQIQREDF